jgi:hypothetical protein
MSTISTAPAGFPRELLEQPLAARLAYFESKIVAHERLKAVHTSLLQSIRHPGGASLILVFGPTGVGKTTLARGITKQLLEDALADPATTPGHIPVAALAAPSPDSGTFSWKDFYIRALYALDEPLVPDKITPLHPGIHRDERGRLVIGRAVTGPDLRRVLEKSLQYRRPRAFLVDEAQHFRKMNSGRRLLDQMDTLKSLAEMTQTVHVLLGTYELLGLLHLSAQLSRRSIEIHFPRYHAERSEEFQEFKKLLRTLQRHLPLAEEPNLEGHAEYFYEHCLGCTGMLKDWLSRTLVTALEAGARTLTPAAWEPHALPAKKRLAMMREISEGEQALQEDGQAQQALRQLLKLEPLPSRQPEAPAVGSPTSAPASGEPPKRRRGRVGQRNPKRDQVGGEDQRAS